MRDLSKVVGVNTAAIYNYFASKKDILLNLYRIYTEQRQLILPDLNELLELTETLPPHEVLMLIDYHFPPENIELMDCVMSCAIQGMAVDPDNRQFIVDNIFASSHELLVPVITKLMKLERIEPID